MKKTFHEGKYKYASPQSRGGDCSVAKKKLSVKIKIARIGNLFFMWGLLISPIFPPLR